MSEDYLQSIICV